LQHQTKKIRTEGEEKDELEYLVEFTPSNKDDNNVQWILESHLFDCDHLITKYWNEPQIGRTWFVKPKWFGATE